MLYPGTGSSQNSQNQGCIYYRSSIQLNKMASNEEELADYEEETEVQEGKGEESKDVKK